MAPRPSNTEPPIPPTTVPGKQSNLSKLLSGTTVAPTPTPTTTIAPPVTLPKKSNLSRLISGEPPAPPSETIKVGQVQVPRTIIPTPDTLEASKALRDQTRKAIQAGVPVQTVQDIVSGEEPSRKNKILTGIFNFDIIPGPLSFKPIKDVVVPGLGALQTGGRAILSTLEEGGDILAGLGAKVRGEEPLKYKATDYIPVHPQTGLPIAKVGDYYIRNWTDIINTPIEGVENAKTIEEAQVLQDKVVKEFARSAAPSFGDIKKATKDFTYSASDIPYIPETGNPIIDGIIDFSYDVAFDPVTYATFGGSALVLPAKEAAEAASKAAVAAAARESARVAAAEATQRAAAVAADATATAAQKAAAQAAADAAEKAAEQAFKKAAAAAPRRVYGRVARETLANNVVQARQAATEIIEDATTSAAQKAVAQDALKVLTDEFIQDVAAKGYSVIRGEAAKVLGVRSGARIGIPFGPKLTVPFTARLTDFFGSTLAGTRFAVFKTEAGQKLLSKITPTGEGGLFGSTDILNMRSALRTKSVPADVAADYVKLLDADRFYRGAIDLRRKTAGAAIKRLTSGENAKLLPGMSDHLATPRSQWEAAGLRALTEKENLLYQEIQTTLDNFYNEANLVAATLGAAPLPKLPDYFPRVQSEQAIEWAAKNADAAKKTADDLGVDRTFFLGNFTPRGLEKGKVWFGNVLKGTETTAQLNDLARPILGFDFFEVNPLKALATYGENHAKYVAYATTLEQLTESAPARLGGVAQNVSELPFVTKSGLKPNAIQLGTLENTIAKMMDADKLALWNEADVLAIRTQIADLQSKLAGVSKIDRDAFQEALVELDEKIIATNRAIEAGLVDPTMGSLLRAEIEDYANALALSINNVKKDFLVTSPTRWQASVREVLDGFTVLNEKTIPDIAVRNEILDIFKNVQRLDDPAFVRLADRALQDYTTFFKSYVTLTPGFHIRNALTNFFMLTAAGANPANLINGLRIYKKYLAAIKKGDNPFAALAAAIPSAKTYNNALDALRYSGATGFGQFGEIAREAGTGRAGVLGREATGRIPFTQVEVPGARQISLILGAPIRGSRRFGTLIEEFNRFQLTFDGLQQGYDAATAAARTQKYLIDYNDLSTADRAIKQIIPFWTWASRNTPLQIENMWLNPKAYTVYNKFRDNLRDEENESPFLREYQREAGAFKLPFGDQLYARPDLGFPGAGQPSLIEEALTSPEQFLSRVSPALRVPVEIWRNRQFFTGAPVTDQKSADANFNKFMYALRQSGAPISLLARYANATPLRRFELMQKIAGTKKVSDEQNATNQEINAGLSLFGLPFFKQLPSDERAEIYRRFFLLLEETEKAKFQKKEKEEK